MYAKLMAYRDAMTPISAKDRRLLGQVPQELIERRSRVRFPLELPVSYRTLDRQCHRAGRGLVMNMSSGGVLVASSHEINAGRGLELSIEWPFLLDGKVPLLLVASGRVVRCGTSSFALSLTRHQFRTTKKRIEARDASHGDSWHQPAKRAAPG